jgi:alpha-methylacyl-CoA racemase
MTATPTLPLRGSRVVCVAVYVPAPAAARRLASLGADVTRVEPPQGDPLAAWSPAWYDALRAGQRVVRLDLRAAAGRVALGELLGGADLLLTALRPSALERLGLDWPRLRAAYPRLCHVAITGYGAPDQDRPGHDLTYQARAGLLSPPHLPSTLVADLAGAERAVSTAVALLLARERGGEAGSAHVALADAAVPFAEPRQYGVTAPGGILGGGLPGYAMYRAQDGWIAVAALEPHFWSTLVTELGLSPTADRGALEEAFLASTSEHWEEWARARGLPIVIVRSPTPGG